jgi:SAM-dependent methyltransferase
LGECDRINLKYEWININEVVDLETRKIILFGAGKGSEEFLGYLKESGIEAEILCILDNDRSLWGKTLCGYPILSPQEVKHKIFDKIVVSSVSGRESISAQLSSIGLEAGRDFILIGRYPRNYTDNFRLLMRETGGLFSFDGSHCLHIGPGGFLAVEIFLYCLGASKAFSIDKYAFGIDYPDVTDSYDDYLKIMDLFKTMIEDESIRNRAIFRFEKLFIKKQNHISVDKEKISYHYPADICRPPFEDEAFDLVISFAVLEHVDEPTRAVEEISRILKPGGVSIHIIVTQDHRSFSNVGKFNPFSFRIYDTQQWEDISRKKFYQNRLLPVQWMRLFEKSEFLIHKYHVQHSIELSHETVQSFHAYFRNFTKKELGEVNCLIVVSKPIS